MTGEAAVAATPRSSAHTHTLTGQLVAELAPGSQSVTVTVCRTRHGVRGHMTTLTCDPTQEGLRHCDVTLQNCCSCNKGQSESKQIHVWD